MKEKINRLFQAMAFTSFLMATYKTAQGITSRKNTELISKEREKEALKNTEDLDTIKTYLEELKDKILHNDNNNKKVHEYIEKNYQSCIDSLNKTNNKLSEVLNDETSSPEIIKDKFNDFSNLLQETIKTCSVGKAELMEILDKINKSSGNKYTIDEISNFLSTLTFEQTVAITHIFGFIVIILSLISLFSVFYGNLLIDYFKLEEKLPRIAKIIQLRRKFQMFYSVLDFTLIFIVISIMFYIDLLLFYS